MNSREKVLEGLRQRFRNLEDDYLALSGSVSNENDAVSKRRGERRLKEMEAELRDINTQLGRWEQERSPSVPLPWAGVERGAAPTARAMYDVKADGVGSFPLDLGTMWGLDRGSFVGVLLATQGTRLCDDLKNVERVLHEAQDSVACVVRLPARWWIEVDPGQFPNGPQNARQIGEAAINDRDPLAAFVAANGFPADVIPGVVLRLSEQETSQRISPIVHWCRALVSDAFVSPAVLIVIEGWNGGATRAQAARLTARLQGIGAPVETMHLSRSLPQDAPAIRGKAHMSNAQAGFVLFCWLLELLDENGDWLTQRDDYPEVISLLNDLEARFSRPSPPLPTVDAQSVVADVDQVIPEHSRFHRQFLHLIASVAPDRLSGMITAYAQSRWPSARREALVVASKPGITSEVDAVVDAWVEGSELDAERFPRGAELVSDPEYGPFADVLALAVLRQADSAPDAAHRILGQLPLPYKLDRVRALRLRDEDASLDNFLETFGAEEYLLAARAGVEMTFSLARYADLPGIWWLLLALSPNKERIAGFLALGKEHRAIVGLLTDEEWEAIRHDEGMKRRIVDHRRGHRVYRRI